MALDKDFDGSNEIASFLEKFKEQPFPAQPAREPLAAQEPSVRPAQYARSFEKLEQKIHELEERFEASTTQNQLILSELARTREAMERQKDKDAFLEHLSRTIASLRTSVESLSRTQEATTLSYREVPVQRSFDPLPSIVVPAQPQTLEAQEHLLKEREEQTRRFNSLRQKASQLKAVNSALDREIKRAQQEKLDALKKSADQAKEILSLRDQLSAAEERFKSFDFEGRIISIKQEYQQKVTHLETRLKEMSDTCMKQVEEIEALKAENTKLQQVTAQKESLQAQLADKDQQLAALKNTIASLQNQNSDQHTKRLVAFTAQLRTLEEQRDRLAVELEQSQMSLETIRREKELLEKNFKELVEKINQNDAVIGQLKEKIEVLGQQNTQLTQHNEELTQTNAVLSQDNATLSQSNVELTHRNAALTQYNAQLSTNNAQLTEQTRQLTQQKTSLQADMDQLHQAHKTLTAHAQQLNLDKQNLSETVEKLHKENQSLAQDKETLEKAKHALAQDKQALEQARQTLVKDNQTLEKNNQALEKDKQTLTDQRAHLEVRAQTLENKTKTLSKENQQLRQQSAALLAARVVQEHSQRKAAQRAQRLEKGQPTILSSLSDSKSALRKPAAPILHSLGRTLTVTATEDEWETEPIKATLSSAQKEGSRLQTSADLPEIKVAEPTLQDELFDGEDFLEKTDSFIGRMKWSIFRENR